MQYKLIAALAAVLVCAPAQADTVTVTASGVLFFGVDPSGIFGGGIDLTGDTLTATITFDTSLTVASEPGKGSVFTVRLPGGEHT